MKKLLHLATRKGRSTSLRSFVHLHTHTEYSFSDGLAKICHLVDKAIADGMPGIAITDHANMFGIAEFLRYVEEKNRELGTAFKPIVGCEVYVARRGMKYKSQREDIGGYHLILLAKNLTGYHNLVKIVSNANLHGFYGRPRTDHSDLKRYHEGLICCSACIGGEVSQHILHNNLEAAEQAAKWHKSIFGEDYYFELQRHKPTIERANHKLHLLEERANNELVRLSKKLGIKLICTNDIHFVEEAEAEVQDTLMCVSWRQKVYDPNRIIFSKQEWMKTTTEMNDLFSDIPEALDNTIEVCNNVEIYSINQRLHLPKPTLPDSVDEVEHLARLVFEGANKRYGKPLPIEVKERLKYELKVINSKGLASYFLMLHEIISAARTMGAQIGVGRDTMACSAVLYCLDITKIDPIKWWLEFGSFISSNNNDQPKVSFDIDERGREDLLQWIAQRYGEACVANISTPLHTSLGAATQAVSEAYDVAVEQMNSNILNITKGLVGVVCGADIHSSGVAICGCDMSERVPLAAVKSSMYQNLIIATQYNGEDLRSAGAATLYILSLKALGVIRHFAEMGAVDIESIPLNDEATFDLLCEGDTEGLFRLNAKPIIELLRAERPTNFEGLVEIYSRYNLIKSHAICDMLLAYRIAYFKAHYPEEFTRIMS